jgi:hypothetical protein
MPNKWRSPIIAIVSRFATTILGHPHRVIPAQRLPSRRWGRESRVSRRGAEGAEEVSVKELLDTKNTKWQKRIVDNDVKLSEPKRASVGFFGVALAVADLCEVGR